MAKTLTTSAIDKLLPSASRREVPDGRVPGLYLVIQPSGAKSWAVRYRHGGRTRKMTIKGYPIRTLSETRDEALRLLQEVDRGSDPAVSRSAARASGEDTVEKQVAIFIERHASKNRTGAEVEKLFKREVTPVWGRRRVGEITQADVVHLLDKIVDRGAGQSANRVFASLRKFGNWCKSRSLIKESFCDGVTMPAAIVRRDRRLSDNELSLVWKGCQGLGYPFGPMVKVLALTAQRREEVAGMRWSELDLASATWTIPRGRVKNDKEHIVSLSAPVLAILSSIPRIKVDQEKESDLVFTTSGRTSVSGFSRAKASLDEAVKKLNEGVEIEAWRFHDLRRTAASGMARIGIGITVVEKILNHTSGTLSGVAGIYQRHEFLEERRQALEAWGSYVMALVEGRPANVVQLRELAR